MIELAIHTQPDDESCGPTSLHAIYRYYGLDISLDQVIKDVERSHSGGTLAPMLGLHALKHDFTAIIYINSLNIFDPTWFEHGEAKSVTLMQKLKAQMRHKRKADVVQASKAYIDYVKYGGLVRFQTLSVPLLKQYFNQQIPILTGLSATYLYSSARERFTEQGKAFYDDIRGTPCGHFVVLCGYDAKGRSVVIADPHRENPLSHNNYYKVSSHRLINAIMLGVLTYDANLLIIQPKRVQCKL